jgi:hypothetical protein
MNRDRRINQIVLVCVTLWMTVLVVILMSKISSLQTELKNEHEKYANVSKQRDQVISEQPFPHRPIQQISVTKYDYGSITSH